MGFCRREGFDAFAEKECLRFYKSEVMGRPSMAPGVYFRMLLIGYFKGLAKASGIDTPTQEDLARMDCKRSKKTSNEDWAHPDDPDAKIAKMKDGSTHLAHKVEHAVDMGDRRSAGIDTAGNQHRRY